MNSDDEEHESASLEEEAKQEFSAENCCERSRIFQKNTNILMSSSTSHNRYPLLCSLFLLGCGLFFPNDFTIPACITDDGGNICDQLNREMGIENECNIYQCRANGHGCDLRSREKDGHGHIICVDAGSRNDSRRIILDGMDKANGCELKHPTQLSVAAAQPAPMIGAVQVSVQEKEGEPKKVWGRGWLARIGAENAQPLSYRYRNMDAELKDGCPDIYGSQQRCDVHQLGFDKITSDFDIGAYDPVITATISRPKCTHGQLRIGLSTVSESKIDLGSQIEGDLGINYPLGDPCDNDTHGARLPTVASLINGTSGNYSLHALVMWLDETNEDPRPSGCSSSPDLAPPLKALSFHRLFRLNGQPQSNPKMQEVQVGARTNNHQPPALVSWVTESQQGFITAYSNQDEKIELGLFKLQDEQDEQDEQVNFIDSFTQDNLPQGIEHVTLSIGDPSSTGALRFLTAFRSGCGEDAEVGIALYYFDPSQNLEDSNFIYIGYRPLRTSSNDVKIIAGPALGYGDIAINDKGEYTSGWVVTWIERTEDKDFLMGFHITEKKNQNQHLQLHETSPFQLTSNTRLDSPVAFSKVESFIRYVYFGVVDNCTSEIIWGSTPITSIIEGKSKNDTPI